MPVKRFGAGSPRAVSREPSVPPRTAFTTGSIPARRTAASACSCKHCQEQTRSKPQDCQNEENKKELEENKELLSELNTEFEDEEKQEIVNIIVLADLNQIKYVWLSQRKLSFVIMYLYLTDFLFIILFNDTSYSISI